MQSLVPFLVLLGGLTAYAQSTLLPLQAGNQWSYRERGGSGTFTVRVGTPVVMSDRIYYSLSGYGTARLLVRFDGSALKYLDENSDQERVLTLFEPVPGAWFEAPHRICDQEGQAQKNRLEHEGPSGVFPEAVTISYRTFSCADAALLNEVYAPNIGMLQRTVNSIRGPRVYDLVNARVGKVNVQADRGAYLRLSVQEDPAGARLTANLELAVQGGQPVVLRFLSSQEFDVVLRAPDGSIVYQWSEGRVFPASVRDESTFGRGWSAEVPLTDKSGIPLAPGLYQLDAWIASGFGQSQFAASTNVIIAGPEPAGAIR